jgi:hypothetical protein
MLDQVGISEQYLRGRLLSSIEIRNDALPTQKQGLIFEGLY